MSGYYYQNPNQPVTTSPPVQPQPPRQLTIQDIALLQLDLIEKLTGVMFRMETMLAKIHGYGYERGTTYAFTLNVTNQLMIIDFIEPNRSRNIDQGLLNVPQSPVSRVLLYNTGTNSAGFSTNRGFSSADTSVPLPPGSAYEIASDFPSIQNLHISSVAAGTSVRVVLIV